MIKEKVQIKPLTIPKILRHVRELQDYKQFLVIKRVDVEKADERLIANLKNAELVVSIRIRDLVFRVLERRVNKHKSTDLDKEIRDFCNNLGKWAKRILPEYTFSLEYFLEEFQAEYIAEGFLGRKK